MNTRNGIAQHFENAYNRGFHTTVRFLESKGFPQSDAEEFAQAAWVRGWERREQLRCRDKLESWINSIAFNMARTNHRRISRRLAPLETDLPVRHSHVVAGIEVHQMLRACAGENRRLLELRYLHGWDINDIARLYRCSSTAVRVRLCRARKRLSESMSTWDDHPHRGAPLMAAA
jgi:RNA polymerase sigma factor (sigma-70 family)